MIYLLLFITFFQIGLFGFGGGYAMLSLIQSEVVSHYHWISSGEFADIVAISQMTPGPIAINSATYCGFAAVKGTGANEMMCILGSCTATFAVVLPSLIMMLIIIKFLMKYKDHIAVQNVFETLRPVVVGLLIAAFLMLCNAENFSTPQDKWHFYISIFIFLFAFIGVKVKKISIIRILLLSGLAGLLLFY